MYIYSILLVLLYQFYVDLEAPDLEAPTILVNRTCMHTHSTYRPLYLKKYLRNRKSANVVVRAISSGFHQKSPTCRPGGQIPPYCVLVTK